MSEERTWKYVQSENYTWVDSVNWDTLNALMTQQKMYSQILDSNSNSKYFEIYFSIIF